MTTRTTTTQDVAAHPAGTTGAASVTTAGLRLVAPDTYEPAPLSQATHTHAVGADGDLHVVPLPTDTGGAVTRRVGSDTYIVYGV